jgi:hypothetical protein
MTLTSVTRQHSKQIRQIDYVDQHFISKFGNEDLDGTWHWCGKVKSSEVQKRATVGGTLRGGQIELISSAKITGISVIFILFTLFFLYHFDLRWKWGSAVRRCCPPSAAEASGERGRSLCFCSLRCTHKENEEQKKGGSSGLSPMDSVHKVTDTTVSDNTR